MKKTLLILSTLLVAILLTACDFAKNDSEIATETTDDFNTSKVTFTAAYKKAQNLGFEGTLEEFIDLISGEDGKDGVSVENMILGADGKLWVILSSGKTIDCGVIKGKDGTDGKDGLTPTFKVENGEMLVSYDDGASWNHLAFIQGEQGPKGEDGATGSNGKDGVGIAKVELNEENNLLITYTDGTTQILIVPNKEHTHAFSEWKTHTYGFNIPCDQIISYRICSECSYTEWKEGKYEEHNFKVYTTAPTCQAGGYDTKICQVCGTVEICNETPISSHTVETVVTDNNFHWQKCNHCDYTTAKANHEYNESGLCKYCFISKSNTHADAIAIPAKASTCQTIGNVAYWFCPDCGKKFSDADRTTEIFNVTLPLIEHEYDYYGLCIYCSEPYHNIDDIVAEAPVITGAKQTITFMITDNSNDKELSSGLRRYLAGDTKYINVPGEIDTLVAKRNGYAMDYANCTVEYQYYTDDDTTDSWGQVGEKIELLAKSVNSPDMFSNFIYDMMNCQLQGCFQNLLNTTNYGTNYFSFKDAGYVDKGYGYMYEYMKSLSLRPAEQLYLVASDYFTDLVRSFLIVPVSNQMMDNIQMGTAEFNKDRDGDGDFNIKDFYKLIRQKQWTYTMLAQYAAEVTKGATNPSLSTSNIGFALGLGSGLPASGLLYTTSVKIINREWSDAKNDYEYYYPETNQELIDFCDNLTNLLSQKGVVVVNPTEAAAVGQWSTHLAIRARFITNNVLFGGIVCLGSLEDAEYDRMKGEGEGFGAVPVPLYRDGSDDTYLTAIHNLGKVGAISAKSANFSVCTAFLEYQSTHSTKVLNTYYNNTLTYDVADGTKEAVAMLDYIRANVRSSFDKVYEDAIGYYTNSDGDKWHIMLLVNEYKFTGSQMATKYEELQGIKQDKLTFELYSAYDNLPK